MKDLLEVIEEGREGFRKWFRKTKTTEVTVDPIVWKRAYTGEKEPERNDIEAFITSHTKAILTNQIERMKEALAKEYEYEHTYPVTITTPFGGVKKGQKDKVKHQLTDEEIIHNHALQTQIDYLEKALSKLT